MNTATQTLSPGYTTRRPIGFVTSNALNILHPAELAWIAKQWRDYEGNGKDDCDFNVIMERKTLITHTRTWTVDRDGPGSSPMVMLPEDY